MSWELSRCTFVGGGNVTPIFTETVIMSNPDYHTYFTFDEDYHNYNFLRFKLYNAGYGTITYILTTPSTVDAIFDVGSYMNFNEFNSDQYCAYSQSSLTWNRYSARNLLISEVVGIQCTNMTVTESVVYKALTRNNDNVAINTELDLMSFDWLMFSSNDGTVDEVQPCNTVFIPSNSAYVANNGQYIYYPFNPYRALGMVQITRHTISAHQYLFIVGINFTPI
jgi:hypothetical protein